MQRVVILGAAGRDFHNFNVVFREDPGVEVVAFTATQIPDIAGRRYPPELAGERYPDGIPIVPEDELESLIDQGVDRVVFSYSDVSHEYVMHLAARSVAAGASFEMLGDAALLESVRPVIAVTAPRTGAGKSQTSRKLRRILADSGMKVAAVRHPMPYGDLVAQRLQRFGSYADLDAADVTIEEREEYEPYIRDGAVIFAGVDYEAILRAAEAEADVIVWDGGNNDLPFYRPTVHICVLDPHRAGHEVTYWPGEVNFRRADVLVINKMGTAPPDGIETVRRNIELHNPDALVIEADSTVTVEDPASVTGRRVLVIEDGPTLTHGEMAYGAGTVAARDLGAAELIDPRPFAVGSIAEVYKKYTHIGPVLPAMGYGDAQQAELKETIEASGADTVVIGTPIDLGTLLELEIPSTRVFYDLEERPGPDLGDVAKLIES
ncbi:MAG: cyclic 2,3-diphosphoglycerate synthase [Acidimicrobiia bacterium]|nr:cyclic 2,3-diphosphoglycerate synthase [Acidimicrobiia bacterium]